MYYNTILLCLSYFISAGYVSSQKLGPRIVGGDRVTNFADFSYQVSLKYDDRIYCGGTIIDSKHILTAAHCCVEEDGKTPFKAHLMVAGTGNTKLQSLKKYSVKNIFVHKDYDKNIINNDIAVLRIFGSFDTKTIIPLVNTSTPVDTACIVSGWGVTRESSNTVSQDLMKADIFVKDWTNCKRYYPSLTENMICAAFPGKDSCQGDSGGPLVCNKLLTGIVSFGAGCAGVAPGVYTDVFKYNSWILEQFTRSSGISIFANVKVMYFVMFILYFVKLI